jgi:hypothetical protein
MEKTLGREGLLLDWGSCDTQVLNSHSEVE